LLKMPSFFLLQRLVFHRDHGELLKVLHKVGALFPTDFRTSVQVCSQDPNVSMHSVVAEEFEGLRDWLEDDRVRKLQDLAKNDTYKTSFHSGRTGWTTGCSWKKLAKHSVGYG
jgi:hypothetical protein